MKPRWDDIPEELRALLNWVTWKLEKVAYKGIVRATKVPYNARTGKHAQSNNPTTWSSFADAVAALERGYDGIGFCLNAAICRRWT
jgi:putative DNA primase/helicase